MSTTSRRQFLQTAAAAAPIAALPLAATAAAPDPIYAAIDLHKQAYARFSEVLESEPDPNKSEPESPEWERREEEAGEAETAASHSMIATVPVTTAGLIALLSYVLSEFDRGHVMFGEEWLLELLRTTVSSLTQLA